jgi:hypothetical protein
MMKFMLTHGKNEDDGNKSVQRLDIRKIKRNHLVIAFYLHHSAGVRVVAEPPRFKRVGNCFYE